MKKLFTIGFFLVIVLLVSSKAEAAASSTATSSPDLPCTVINVNLCPDAPNEVCPGNLYKPGATNDNKDFIFKDWKPVSVLQKFLIKAGYLKAGIMTGNYGPLTKSAITKFQNDYGVKDTIGYTGPATRAQIKKLSCGLDSILPDLKVESLNVSTTTSLTLRVDAVIKNIGHNSASSSAVYAFTELNDGSATLATSTCSTADLPAGASCKVSYNLSFKNAGIKELVFKADSKNKIKESNENNNTEKSSLIIKIPIISDDDNSDTTNTDLSISNFVIKNETSGKDVTTLNIAPYYVNGVKTERQFHFTWDSNGFTDEDLVVYLTGSDGYTKLPFSGKTIKVSDERYDFSGASLRVTAAVAEGSYKLKIYAIKDGKTVSTEKDVIIVKN